MDIEDLTESAALARRQRYISDRGRAQAQGNGSKRWQFLGKDATTTQGIVRSGDGEIRRGDIVTNGYIVPGTTVEVTQGGGRVEIDAQKWVRPKPVTPVPYLPKKNARLDVWAIGLHETATTTFVELVNLITGTARSLTSIPREISPCGTTPPNFPTVAELPVTAAGEAYIHIWHRLQRLTNAAPVNQPVGASCSSTPPTWPGFTGISPLSVIGLRSQSDGTTWAYRTYTGTASDAGGAFNWTSQSITTITRSSTPPTVDDVYAITGNASTFAVDWAGNYLGTTGTPLNTGFTYVSANCASIANPTIDPPIDTRNPSGTPIQNQYLITLSIDKDRKPIAHIRHTKNCANPLVWNFDRSYTLRDANVLDDANPIREYAGRLSSDWRHQTTTFPCQVALRSELFVNVDAQQVSPATPPAPITTSPRLWFIPLAERPASFPANGATPAAQKVRFTTANPASCTTFPPAAAELNYTGKSNSANILTIHTIAALNR